MLVQRRVCATRPVTIREDCQHEDLKLAQGMTICLARKPFKVPDIGSPSIVEGMHEPLKEGCYANV